MHYNGRSVVSDISDISDMHSNPVASVHAYREKTKIIYLVDLPIQKCNILEICSNCSLELTLYLVSIWIWWT